LKKTLKRKPSVEFPVCLSKLCHSAQPHLCRAPRFFERHAPPQVFFREHLEVLLKLSRKIFIDAAHR
jgi:hypothetical protein